ncbi:MAG: C1 family peptidase [Corynebacterium sp.]|nr:C1 family peptidase [Corynebacterium sp.]
MNLEPSHVTDLGAALQADRGFRIARNAVAATPIASVVRNRTVLSRTDPSVEVKLDEWGATDQQKSGRCWIFSGLNMLRASVMGTTGQKDLELSQAYIHFWDKLEKSNYFLQAMVELAPRPLTDRTVDFLLKTPIEDGGQWDMFAGLIAKYGAVPKTAMPETYSSSHTRLLNRDLATVLRQAAMDIRHAAAGDTDAIIETTLATVYRILLIHLGTPPREFSWQYRDKDSTFHREDTLTPQQFAATYLPADLDTFVTVVHDPRHAPGDMLTVDYLGNIVGADPSVLYLNATPEAMRKMVRTSLDAGRPVWFGCDTLAQSDRDSGTWDAHMLQFSEFYGVKMDMTKRERIETGDSLMSHAMVFTGYDAVAGRWRVENSWGTEQADKGFWTMNDSWFDEYVFAIAVPRAILPAELASHLTDAPIHLPAWDPMGAVA